ncbi:hypothetical protein [Streptomyces griseorubiginosus]|uniref:Hydrophobic W protein n=1 Tax=Streptomyces griseorubiginosus TaxID=67304 RepID=A0AAI8PS71_9ACTN|nr:hypothetical protein [Streptomyces griseorubiginosus]AYC43144.1 hypothetical protein DWG14_07450 [Streptomyces griseorubiginosus]
MSRGEEEETDEPVTGSDHPVPGPRHAVVISGDGSATIDGEPVEVADGESVDAAILDRLQGYARDLDAGVTATISDPSAGYVAFVEVAPDGSSSLLEQREALPEPAEVPGSVSAAVPDPADVEADEAEEAEEAEDAEEGEADEGDEDEDEADEDDGFDVEPYSQEHQQRPAAPPPPVVRLAPKVAPKAAPRNGTRQSDDEYKSPGLLHKPLVVGPVALGVAALVIVPLVILGSSAPDDGGRQKQTARSSAETETPLAEDTPSATSSTVRPSPSASAASPSAKSKASASAKTPKKKGGEKGGVGGVGGVTVTVTARPPRATVTARPAQETAATAVNRLHRSDPSGRHICYRAYLSGQGWQKPVCDGTLAGTTSGTHPIKALNIAVYGGAGSAANAFVHDAKSTDGRGKWKPHWTAVIGDGKNNYIGSTKSSAPYMTGFAINIGSGQLCRSTKVHGYDWGSADCTQPRPGYIFGGALENTRWLEAVKLWL